MTCKRCGSDHVSVQAVQTSAKTATKKTGCLWGIGRAFMVLCTGGLWLLFGKRKGTSNTRFAHSSRAVCQKCGYSWDV